MMWPFKEKLSACTYTWCYFFFKISQNEIWTFGQNFLLAKFGSGRVNFALKPLSHASTFADQHMFAFAEPLHGLFPGLLVQCISVTYPRRTAVTRSDHVTRNASVARINREFNNDDGNVKRQRERQKKQYVYWARHLVCTCIIPLCTLLCRYGCTTTTWKCLISRFVKNVNKRRRNFLPLFKLECGPHEIKAREGCLL